MTMVAMLAVAVPAAAQSFTMVDVAVQAGIREGLYPGAVVMIGRRDSILYTRGYGHFTWNPSSRAWPVQTPDATGGRGTPRPSRWEGDKAPGPYADPAR